MTDDPEPPPQTGSPEIDAALADLADLHRAPAAEHEARLAAAHERVNAVLNRPVDEPGPAGGSG